MGIPTTPDHGVLLVFLNGVKLSAKDDFAIEGRFIQLAFPIQKEDRLTLISLSSAETVEFEVESPYRYDAWTWFDPSDPHDPTVKEIDAPAARVTQL